MMNVDISLDVWNHISAIFYLYSTIYIIYLCTRTMMFVLSSGTRVPTLHTLKRSSLVYVYSNHDSMCVLYLLPGVWYLVKGTVAILYMIVCTVINISCRYILYHTRREYVPKLEVNENFNLVSCTPVPGSRHCRLPQLPRTDAVEPPVTIYVGIYSNFIWLSGMCQ